MKKSKLAIQPSWKLKALTTTVLSVMAVQSTNASDLEIYKGASTGGATIMMMLDTSGSMGPGSISEDYTNQSFSMASDTYGNIYCNSSGTKKLQIATKTQAIYDNDGKVTSDPAVSYSVSYCLGSDGKTPYYDRISRLKMALIPMLANPKIAFGTQDITKIKIGLGNFFTSTSDTSISGGKVTYPASNITLTNRKAMLDIIKGLSGSGLTPTAHAYAEAGSYMMGTTTSFDTPTKTVVAYREVGYQTGKNLGTSTRPNWVYTLYKCNSNTNTTLTNTNEYACNGTYTAVQTNVPKASLAPKTYLPAYDTDDSGSSSKYFMSEQGAVTETKNYSGIGQAVSTAVKNSKYISPIPDKTDSNSASTCEGYGVYFLTDGAPNRVNKTSAADLMNTSMDGKVTIGDTKKVCNSGLTGGSFVGSTSGEPGWECIGEYAKALRNTANPKATSVVTAAAGFGADFKAIANAGKTGGKYNCDATGLSEDAKNLCKLGEKGYGYGEGGFFYVESDTQLASSVVDFIAGVGNKEIPAISTGTMSVPVDSLNTSQSRGYAYMPILDPKPGQTDLWNGNLKKYYIRHSTITSDDAGTIPVFSDRKGNFALNTADIWNTIVDDTRKDAQRPDKGQPQVGGTYQKEFENSPVGRNLFVNNVVSNVNTLTAVNVTSNKPVGFTALRPNLLPDETVAATRSTKVDSILNNLLVFMGYPAQTTAALDDTKTITGTFDKTTKNLGGVLHSLPQLVTYKADLDADGAFKDNTRKDNVLYGSMDGALHMVDDATGVEKFTFIPKEILELQAGALAKGKTTDSKQPHGIDAPWSVFANYDFSQSGTTTSYKAIQVLATGGLRMGGSTYYSLDITDETTPKMVYSVGSNYAKVQQGMTTTLKGMANGVEGTTGDQAAYQRMGQSWGKPSVGYVMSGGKKVMVNFLPGGYDTCYENATFKLNDGTNTDVNCKSKAEAQGNAVYMVKVGEQSIDATSKKPIVTTSSDSGKLLWWATKGSSTDGKTTAQATLQQSTNANLTNSIVTEIRAVDRNYDGLTDHIYFADLGGRVWRADISNNKDTTNFKVDRVVNILDVSDQASGTDAPPRFYERPLMTVTNKVNGKVQGMITVGTGNRSAPVSDKRNTADAIYTFMDPDVAKPGLFCYNAANDCTPTATATATTFKVSDLATLQFTTADKDIPVAMKNKVNNTTVGSVVAKAGWYYPLSNWIDETGSSVAAKGLKMFNEPDAQAGLLFTAIYNPNINLTGGGCSAGVEGVTQRSLMCLPFGNCASLETDADYTKHSVVQSGVGIVDNIITQTKDKDNLYGFLDTYCTGADCTKTKIIPPECIVTATNDCKDYNIKSGINRDKLINPREWWEK